MTKMAYTFLAIVLLPSLAFSQDIWKGYEYLFEPLNQYHAIQTSEEIEIDGHAAEKAWESAPWSEWFIDINTGDAADNLIRTRYKLLWDKQNFYVFAENYTPHIWTFLAQTEFDLSEENNFRIFLDPDNDGHNGFVFGVNANNKLIDRFMKLSPRIGGEPEWGWSAKGIKNAVHLHGTLNNPSDIDTMWTLEIAIPWAAMRVNNKFTVPEPGDYCKANFARLKWETVVSSGIYRKKTDAQRKLLPRQNWVWQPQHNGNMNFPEQWGIVYFSDEEKLSQQNTQNLPVAEKYGKYLWLLYYKQLDFKKEHLEYATDLADFGMVKAWKTHSGEPILYNMDVRGNSFVIHLTTRTRVKLSINQDGLFQVLNP